MMFKHVIAAQIAYMITLWLCRISALAFYARISKNVVQLQTILVISWVVVSVTLVGQLLIVSLQCLPIYKMRNPMIKGGCINDVTIFLPTAGSGKYPCSLGLEICILTECYSRVRHPGVAHPNCHHHKIEGNHQAKTPPCSCDVLWGLFRIVIMPISQVLSLFL
jgi:hypothetical protein